MNFATCTDTMRTRWIEEGRYPFGPGLTGAQRWIGPAIGLLWLALPLASWLDGNVAAWEVALVAVGLPAFVLLYLRELAHHDAPLRTRLLSMAGMLAVALGLTLGVDASWGTLFVYAAVPAGLRLPEGVNFMAVLAIVALGAGALALGGAEPGAIAGVAGFTFGIGALFLMIGELVRANVVLRAARAELAELAVAEERLRFSRDLHDLLGHDLSLIALKAELAGKLLPERADQAAAEVTDIKTLTRDSLAQVREAVGGYRRPSLSSELAGARMALDAAGIEVEVDAPDVPLEPDAESVLAWAVREGATNVIRHSHARRVAIAIRPDGRGGAAVEITDDGRSAGHATDAGHGLGGLSERAGSLGGTLEAGAVPGGGFRLRVRVPAEAVESAA